MIPNREIVVYKMLSANTNNLNFQVRISKKNSRESASYMRYSNKNAKRIIIGIVLLTLFGLGTIGVDNSSQNTVPLQKDDPVPSDKWFSNLDWSIIYEQSGIRNFHDAIEYGGNYTAAGRGGSNSVLMLKFNSSGDILVEKEINMPDGDYEEIYNIDIDENGTIYAIGEIKGDYSDWTDDAFISKIHNETYDIEWTKLSNQTAPAIYEHGRDIKFYEDNLYCIIQYENESSGYDEMLLEKRDLDGNLLQNSTFIVENRDVDPTSIVVNSSGTILISLNVEDSPLEDVHILKYDTDLNFLGNFTYYCGPNTDNVEINKLLLDENTDDLYAAGWMRNLTDGSHYQASVWKYDNTQSLQWLSVLYQSEFGTSLSGLCMDDSYLYGTGFTTTDIDDGYSHNLLVMNLTKSDGEINDFQDWGNEEDQDEDGYCILVNSTSSKIYTMGSAELGMSYYGAVALKWENLYNHNPTLSGNELAPIEGTISTSFNFNVTYTDSDGDLPESVEIHLDNGRGDEHTLDMSQFDSDDSDVTDGKLYTRTTTLEGGSWHYYYTASDGVEQYRFPTGNTNFTGINVNFKPKLTDADVDPDFGSNSDDINFTVVWTDEDNEAPEEITVYVNETEHVMVSNGSTDWRNGVMFYYETTLDWGYYEYYFNASDGNYTITNPTNAPTSFYHGPVINTVPFLSMGGVNATYQTKQDLFNFTVVYTDAQNTAPTYMNLILDGLTIPMDKVVPTDNTYTDGVLYEYTTYLTEGSHGYYFECSDGLNVTRYPNTGEFANATVECPGILQDGTEPTVDGWIDPDEWSEANMYVKMDERDWMDVWLVRNSTHLMIAANVTITGPTTVDLLSVYLDEGNDGYNGSGSFDGVLTDYQEDIKELESDGDKYDGCWNDGWTENIDETDWKGVMYWNTTGVTRYECELSIPLVGRDGVASDPSDLNVTVVDKIGINIEFYGTSSYLDDNWLGTYAYDEHYPLDLSNMKMSFDNHTVNQSPDSGAGSITLDGLIDLESEWNSSLYFHHMDSRALMDVYITRNSSHLLIAMKQDGDSPDYDDELYLYFDEGDDGLYGSGNRDGTATVNGEDVKYWIRDWDSRVYDGYWESGGWTNLPYSSNYPSETKIVSGTTGENTVEYEIAVPLIGNDGTSLVPTNDLSDLNASQMDTIGFYMRYCDGGYDWSYFPSQAYDGSDQTNQLYYMGLDLGNLNVEQDEKSQEWQSASLNPDQYIWVNGSATADIGSTISSVEVLPIDESTSNLTAGTFSVNQGDLADFAFYNTSNIPDGNWFVTVQATTSAGETSITRAYINVDSTVPEVTQDSATSNSTVQIGNHDGTIFINGSMSDQTSGLSSIAIIPGSGNLTNTFSTNQLLLSGGQYSFENTSAMATGSYWGKINATDTVGNSKIFHFGFEYLQITPAALQNAQISKTGGNVSTIFVVTVDVVQPENIVPNWVTISISNGLNWTLTKSDPTDNDYTDGVQYNYTGLLPVGDADFWFTIDDGRYINVLYYDPVIDVDNHLNCPELTQSVNMDGRISAGEWDDALVIDASTCPSQNGAVYYLKYDSNYLYFGVEGFAGLNEHYLKMWILYEFAGDGVLTASVDRWDMFAEKVMFGTFWYNYIYNNMWTGSGWGGDGNDGSWTSPYYRDFTSSPLESSPHQMFEIRLDLDDPNVQVTPGDSLMLSFNLNYLTGYVENRFPLNMNRDNTNTWFNLTLTQVDDPPTSDSPADRTVTEGQTGGDSIISWDLDDDIGGSHYTIYVDEVPDGTSQPWPSQGLVDYQFDTNQDLGLYNVTIMFNDTCGQTGRDTVWVTLEEQVDNPPTSDSPIDRTVTVGEIGGDSIISWDLDDDIGGSHYTIYVDEVPDGTSQPWPSQGLVDYQFDTNQDLGLYNVTIMFNDTSGQTGRDTVWVTLEAAPSNTAPVIRSVKIAPETAYEGDEINITVYGTDDSGITAAWLNITHENGQCQEFSMVQTPKGNWSIFIPESFCASPADLTLKVIVTDGEYNTTTTVDLTINKTIDEPDDLMIYFIIGGVIAVVAIISVVVVRARKKGRTPDMKDEKDDPDAIDEAGTHEQTDDELNDVTVEENETEDTKTEEPEGTDGDISKDEPVNSEDTDETASTNRADSESGQEQINTSIESDHTQAASPTGFGTRYYCQHCQAYHSSELADQGFTADKWMKCPDCNQDMLGVLECPNCQTLTSIKKSNYNTYKDSAIECPNCGQQLEL